MTLANGPRTSSFLASGVAEGIGDRKLLQECGVETESPDVTAGKPMPSP